MSVSSTNLPRTAGLTAKRMLRAVWKTNAAVQVAINGELSKGTQAWSEAGRAKLYDRIDDLFKHRLNNALQEALTQLSGDAATSGNDVARRAAGEAIPKFSEAYLRDYLERVTPKNAPSLAAVYTSGMAASAKTALRLTAVDVFTTAAAAGLSTRERMKLFQAEWASRSANDYPFRFVDRGGRRWENARYVQMLARTTAQRVQTASFCDSMLQGGFPLARISSDSGAHECDICREWEGRLIDLTPGHTLKGGTHTLSEAREAGVFHPNCTHRLEYVPLADYPKAIFEKVKDKLGEDDAFGKPNPKKAAALPTAAQTRKHISAVEEEAKKKAEAEAEAAKAKRLAELDEILWRNRDAEEAREAEHHRLDGIRAQLSDLSSNGKLLGGSTGAYLIEQDGRRYVAKAGASGDHMRSEAAADDAYAAAGIRVPKHEILLSSDGKPYKVSEFVEGEQLGNWMRKASAADRKAMSKNLAEGLDVDAMLGNWDVIGASADNVLVDKNGNPWRIDNGGSLSFRAQGAKKDGWSEGWPDELFSISGNGNNKAYVGDITPLQLVRQAAKRDWEAVVGRLPEADKAPMRRRIAEMRQLAARAEDFTKGGYTDDYNVQILTHSYNLSKEGFREEVPKTIKSGDYGFCRSKPDPSSIIGGKKGENYGELAKAAAITINHHLDKGDTNFNKSTLEAFYAKESALKEVVAKNPKNKGAKYYLGLIEQIKAAEQSKSKLPILDTDVKVIVKEDAKSAKTPKYTSLTDHIAQYMKANGGDYGFISSWASSQAGDSWNLNACQRKIIQLSMRGLVWDPPPSSHGVWYGSTSQRKAYDSAIRYYKNNPKTLLGDTQSVAQYHAAIQLVLENANFGINNHEKRTVVICRTENDNVITKGTPTPGKAYEYKSGACESHSVFRTYIYRGNNTTIVEVPYSRILGTYFLERTPGAKNGFFANDSENEFTADVIGLKRVACGKVNAKIEELFDEFEKNL